MHNVSTITATSRRNLIGGAALVSAGLLTSNIFGEARAAATHADGSLPLARLDMRENPFGPSPKAVEAILEHAAYANRYASDEKKTLTEYIAAAEGVEPAQIVLGNGSKPILAATGAYFARRGGDMVTADRTYNILYESAAAFGATLVQVPLTPEWDFDYAAMLTKIGPNTAGVYLCNPNGSSGRLSDTDMMRAFIVEASKFAPVFVDETYLDMTDGFPANSMIPLVRAGHNVVVSRTLSKLHGLAGQRIGYAIGRADHVAAVQALLTNHVNRVALVAGLASLKDTGYQADMRVKLARGRDELAAIARSNGLTFVPGSALNGIVLDVGMPVTTLHDRLITQGVQIPKDASKEHPTWTSICVGTESELARFKAALGPALHA